MFAVLLLFGAAATHACLGSVAYTASASPLKSQNVIAAHDFEHGTITVYAQLWWPHNDFEKLINKIRLVWSATNGSPAYTARPSELPSDTFALGRLVPWRKVHVQTVYVPLQSEAFRKEYEAKFPRYKKVADDNNLSFDHVCE